MHLDKIKKHVNDYCKNTTFERLQDQILNLFMQNMLLEGKYVPPDRAYDMRTLPDGTREVFFSEAWADMANEIIFTVRKTKSGTLLVNEGTQWQIEIIGNKTYQYGKEIDSGLLF